MFWNIQEVGVQAGDRLELQLVTADDQTRCAVLRRCGAMNEPRRAGADLSPAEQLSGEGGAATLMDGWSCFQLLAESRDRDNRQVYLGGKGRGSKMASSQEVSTSF